MKGNKQMLIQQLICCNAYDVCRVSNVKFDADIVSLIRYGVTQKLQTKKIVVKKISALTHQSCREPEVSDGIGSDEMPEGDFDQ